MKEKPRFPVSLKCSLPSAVTNRQGAGGVLILVLVILFIIASLTIGRSFFATTVSDRTVRSVYGDVASQLLANVLRECHFRLSRIANDSQSSNDLFNSFRSGESDFTATIPLSRLPVSANLLAEFKGYELPYDEVEVKCLSRHPVSVELPAFHDSYGFIEVSATIKHVPTGVVRTRKEVFPYRTTLAAAPIPLSGFTFLTADGVFLINSHAIDGEANKTIDSALSRINDMFDSVDDFIDKERDIKRELEDRASSEPEPAAGKYEAAAREVENSIAVFERTASKKPVIKVLSFGQPTESDDRALHYFAPPPNCLYSTETALNLSDINLPDKVKDRLIKIKAAERKLKVVADEFTDYVESKPSSLTNLTPLTEKFCDALIAATKEYEQLLLSDYKNFQDLLSEVGTSSYPEYLQSFLQMKKSDIISKATAVITEADDGTGRDINSKLNDFLDSHDRYSGLIFVANRTADIQVNRQFKGRILLVAEKDIIIDRAVIGDENLDVLTIASFGKMTLRGQAQASLVPWLSFASLSGATVKGNIIFRRMNFTGGEPGDVLGAQITYDNRLSGASGSSMDDFKKHIYVSISPYCRGTEIKRR